jgi:diguanylate cyclase (GGDEF)-like protein
MVPICETIAPVIAHTPEGQKETGRMKLFTHYELKPKGPDSGSLEIDIAEKKFVLDMVGKFIGNAFAYGLDSLTGLLSGKVFESMFNEKVSEAAAKNGNISLIISKIDPLANTARSKKAVEYVISETADILRNTLKSGSVFRVNEDIFAIVLEDSVGKAAKAAEQLRVAIESHAFNYVVETSPFESFPMPIKVTCSFGVSGFDILGKDSKAEKMVLSADAYLEIARKLGRNQVFPCPDGE